MGRFKQPGNKFSNFDVNASPARSATMHFASLTPSGAREADFEPQRETPLPKAEAQCSSR